jgi:hypothetical protein
VVAILRFQSRNRNSMEIRRDGRDGSKLPNWDDLSLRFLVLSLGTRGLNHVHLIAFKDERLPTPWCVPCVCGRQNAHDNIATDLHV